MLQWDEDESVGKQDARDGLFFRCKKNIPHFLWSYFKLQCEFLDFFAQCHADAAENFAQSFKERITEGLNAEWVNAADALRLNQTALDAGNHGPDVAEGDAGKQEAPEQSDWDAKDSRQDAVAPVFGHSKSSVAEPPHSIQAVCAIRLCDYILKLHLIRQFKQKSLVQILERAQLFQADQWAP